MPPRGHYLADEVGRLAGVSGHKIGQWLKNGYIRASQSGDGYPKVYAYQDIGEAILVHELLERGAKLHDVKNAIAYLRSHYPYDWPLQHSDIQVGAGVITDEVAGEPVDVGHRVTGQGFLIQPDQLERIRDLLAAGGWAARERRFDHIEVDPDRLSGRPTIKGRRIPVEDVAKTALTADGRETLHEGYDLTDHEIDDAVAWWQRVQEYEAA